MTQKAGFTDIRSGDWIDRSVPALAQPYLRLVRLDRPIGTWLLLLPCWWGVALASPGWPEPQLLVLFAIGALLMRGAGCTFNDIVDRDFDARVARTRVRPIPSGALSLRAAVLFLGVQLLAAFAVLLAFNAATIALGVASLALVAAYPFMKRITWWPQAFLGLTFNWGVLMGWTAVAGGIETPALLLYAGAIAWTIGYDTIYAHQDEEDDALIGVRSTARLFGERSPRWIAFFYGLAVLGFSAAGLAAERAWPYWLAVICVALQMGWQLRGLDTRDAADCLRRFRSNRWIGWMVFAGLVGAAALPTP